jgi:hypothetical protein
VALTDNKEGVLGCVARQLEIPARGGRIHRRGGRAAGAVDGQHRVNGDYLTSEGKTGDAVWGTRGRWCTLGAKIGDEPVTIAILDHPGNPGFPTYWHARGYGLFAANPLGQKALSNGKDELNFALEAGKSVTFRHRVMITSTPASAASAAEASKAFVAAYK